MSWIAIGVGVATTVAGSAVSANAKSKAKKAARNIANTPGVDLGEIAQETQAFNKESLASAAGFAGDVNKANQEELLRTLRAAVPNLDQLIKKSGSTVESFFSDDAATTAEVQDITAARAFAGGFSGSPVHQNLEARNLGLKKLERQAMGLDYAMRWIGFAKQALTTPQFDVTTQFLSPLKILETRSGERAMRIGGKQAANQMPGASAVWGNMLTQTGGMFVGGGVGGGFNLGGAAVPVMGAYSNPGRT